MDFRSLSVVDSRDSNKRDRQTKRGKEDRLFWKLFLLHALKALSKDSSACDAGAGGHELRARVGDQKFVGVGCGPPCHCLIRTRYLVILFFEQLQATDVIIV